MRPSTPWPRRSGYGRCATGRLRRCARQRAAYLQLPAPPKTRDPYEVLGARPDTALEDIEAMFRIKAKRLHPDVGGSGDEMKELNEAWERIKAERGSGS